TGWGAGPAAPAVPRTRGLLGLARPAHVHVDDGRGPGREALDLGGAALFLGVLAGLPRRGDSRGGRGRTGTAAAPGPLAKPPPTAYRLNECGTFSLPHSDGPCNPLPLVGLGAVLQQELYCFPGVILHPEVTPRVQRQLRLGQRRRAGTWRRGSFQIGDPLHC